MVASLTPRNAPCPCGSGKKYKLCCLIADGGAPPTSAKEVADAAISRKAYVKLTAFAESSSFDADRERAFVSFWGPRFFTRPERQRAEAFEVVGHSGHADYFMRDYLLDDGASIVERFLREPRKGLSPGEISRLQKLSSARIHLFRIDEVRVNHGIVCRDLWTDTSMDIRDTWFAREFLPGSILAARCIAVTDTYWEADFLFYDFTSEQCAEMLAVLRAEYATAHDLDPTLTEERFLKQYSAPLINRWWFDQVFFSPDADDIDDGLGLDDDDDPWIETALGEDDDCDDDDVFGDEGPFVFARLQRRPIPPSGSTPNAAPRDDFHTDVVSADATICTLRDFLDFCNAADAMTIDWLHGFLCAIACGPSNIAPDEWLPHIWGDSKPTFVSTEHEATITRLIIELASSVEFALAKQTLEPLLPHTHAVDATNVAQRWCAGFEDGMRLDAAHWAPLLEDEEHRFLVAPLFILTLGTANLSTLESTRDMIAKSISALPSMLYEIDDFWNGRRRPTLPVKPVLARRPYKLRNARHDALLARKGPR